MDVYRNFEHTFVFSQREMQDIFNDEFGHLKELSFNPFTYQFKLDKVTNGKIYNQILNDQKAGMFITQVETND